MSNSGNKITFILNDQPVTLDFDPGNAPIPSTTVLNYLRSLPGLRGVKEGCAEGDCGACTVVLAEKVNGAIRYKAVDSCLLFLPALHGRQLITVEGLQKNDTLHPVQQQLVDHYGSQCGYCTPGVAMSLFALYKNHRNLPGEAIADALTGNLCRCTGYRPIVDAAVSACSRADDDHFTISREDVISRLGDMRKNRMPLQLQAANQVYLKPYTLEDALRYRRQFPGAILVCGATDVALRQNKKHEFLLEILDISGVEELSMFRETQQAFLVGSTLPLEELRQEMKGKFGAFYQMLSTFGSLQIRNVATLGGNIGSASPIGDALPLLMACRASLELRSVEGIRTIGIGDFITGYRKTSLRPGEIITCISIPKPEQGNQLAFYKVSKRRHLDIATVSAAFSLRLAGSRVEEAILAYGGMAATPVRALATEQFLTGKEWNRHNTEEAMILLRREFTPISDARAEQEYRKTVAGNLLLKFYLETSQQL